MLVNEHTPLSKQLISGKLVKLKAHRFSYYWFTWKPIWTGRSSGFRPVEYMELRRPGLSESKAELVECFIQLWLYNFCTSTVSVVPILLHINLNQPNKCIITPWKRKLPPLRYKLQFDECKRVTTQNWKTGKFTFPRPKNQLLHNNRRS